MSAPVDWTGLLKWSMAYHDGTRDTDVKEMSKERKEFILNAMDNMIMDEMRRVRILLGVLELPDEDRDKLQEYVSRSRHALRVLEDRKNLHTLYEMRTADKQRAEEARQEEEQLKQKASAAEDDRAELEAHKVSEEELTALQQRLLQEKIESLDELIDRVGKIDNAVGLIKFDGLPVLRAHLRHHNEEIRALAAQVISTVVQNNPIAQLGAIRAHTLQTLLALLNVHPAPKADGTFPELPPQFSLSWTDYRGLVVSFSPVVASRTKQGLAVVRSALYALASLLSNNLQGQLLFIQNNGLARLVALLNDLNVNVAVPFDTVSLKAGEPIQTDLSSAWAAVHRRTLGILLIFAQSALRVPKDVSQNAIQSVTPGFKPPVDEEEEAKKGVALLESLADAHAAQTSAAPASTASASTALIEVDENTPSGGERKEFGPAGAHPAWHQLSLDKQPEVPAEGSALDLIAAALKAAVPAVNLVTLIVSLRDQTGREDGLKLIELLSESNAEFAEWLGQALFDESRVVEIANQLTSGHEDALAIDMADHGQTVPALLNTIGKSTTSDLLARHVLLLNALSKLDSGKYDTERAITARLAKSFKR